jgi:hypothetical protein
MKTIGFRSIIFGILLAAALASAEDRSNQTTDGKTTKVELRTVIGCLSKTDNTYVITGGAPGPKQFRIIGGDTTKFRGQIGQTVRVVGLVGKSGPLDNVAPPYHEGSTTGVGYNTIIAEKIKVLGGMCSNPGEEYAGDHE